MDPPEPITELLKDKPLYSPVKINEEDVDWIYHLKEKEIHLDGFCPACRKISTFRSSASPKSQRPEVPRPTSGPTPSKDMEYNSLVAFAKPESRVFQRVLKCTRNPDHVMSFSFLITLDVGNQDQLLKIGQYPSPVDLKQLHDEKYEKIIEEILEPKKSEEYKKAIIAHAHGFGIGAFVYLRRIFESLIYDAYETHKDQLDEGDKKDFKRGGMEKKIKALESFLPKIVSNNKHLYSVLSKGVHELDKSECSDHFEVVKEMMELILDKVYNQLKEAEKKNKLETELNELHSKLSDDSA